MEYTIMSRLRKINGTVHSTSTRQHPFSRPVDGKQELDLLLINVLTELIRLINFAFTLVESCMPPGPPKEGSMDCVVPHPTVFGER